MSGPWMKGGNWRAAVANEAAGRRDRANALNNMSVPPHTPVRLAGNTSVAFMVVLWTPPSCDQEHPLAAWKKALGCCEESSATLLQLPCPSRFSMPAVAPVRMNPAGPPLPEDDEFIRWSLWIRLRSSRTVFIAGLQPMVRPHVLSQEMGVVLPIDWEFYS
ncbi:MAG: hypothetical protein QGG74_06330 [Phycisphaerales bacterium]|nr:hypothetical protein [Phycisphaerales bacterium]